MNYKWFPSVATKHILIERLEPNFVDRSDDFVYILNKFVLHEKSRSLLKVYIFILRMKGRIQNTV